MFRAISFVLVSLVMIACEGPFGVTSGGELSGSIQQPPALWQLSEESGLAQLETRPDDPYSVNLAYVQMNDQLYIYAGDTRTTWVEHIEQNPLIRIRIGETIYPVRAARVEDHNEFTAFANIWANWSVFSRDPKELDEVWLYRLVAR